MNDQSPQVSLPPSVQPPKGPEVGSPAWMVNQVKIDLKFLCTYFLGYKDWSSNLRLHRDIRFHLDKPSKYKLFLLPRDHLKSSIITKGAAIQRILRNPDIRILIANNTWDNSRKFLRSIQSHLSKGSKLSAYFGRFEGPIWTQDEIVIKQRQKVEDAPTIATTGLEKEQTSQHYDLIIADDLVARENSATAEQRTKVKEYINSLFSLLEPEGQLWIVGTRWSQDDAYGDLIEEGLWDILIRTCWQDEERTIPAFPEKFSKELLDLKRQKIGPVNFSCQYLNDPLGSEAADFKRDQIKFYQPGTDNPQRLYMAVDPAHSLGADADFSAGVVGGMYADSKIRVVDYFKKKVLPNDLVNVIFEMVKKWKLRAIGIETFAFQKTLKYEIQRRQRETKLFFSVDELGTHRGGKFEPPAPKEARIRSMQPMFEQGLIELRWDMRDMVDELLAFPRGKRDDLIDALAYLKEHLVPSMQLSTETSRPGEVYNKETGKYSYTMKHWTKNFMPQPQASIYERFMADLK